MIKAQHLYWVKFNPARYGEFPDTHLAIVLELNADKKTCRVLPLTRSSQGLGSNKISIGMLHEFTDISYAVLDQVRTIAMSRMSQHVNDDGTPIDIKIPNDIYCTVKTAIISREEINLSQNQLIDFYSKRVIELKKKYIVNQLYKIMRKSQELNTEQSEELRTEFENEIASIKLDIETQINHFIDVEEFIESEHPALSDYLKMIDISIVELNMEIV